MNGHAKTYFCPTRIIHGLGAVSILPDQVSLLGCSKPFVCTDAGLTAAGVTGRIVSLLESSSLPYVLFDEVEEDPGNRTVQAGAELFAEAGCDLVIAVGGGSPMCAGKGIALVAAGGGLLPDYEGFNKADAPPYPVIAIPTTAGSGTEVSKVTILTDEERNFKMSIIDERTYPEVALLDASLMATLPRGPALIAGMDALAHALDALWSKGATAFSDAYATVSAATIFSNLAEASVAGDLTAKQAMLEASSMANIATGTALPGLAHVLSQPLGRLHISHGLGTGIMLPYAMRFNLPMAAARVAPIARLLGEQGSDEELGERLLQRLWDLMREVEFPTKLDPDVVTLKELPALVDQCTKVVNYEVNLRKASPEDLMELYAAALGRE
ncbi:MAG: iron-containing alcohol dehydrogenase [Thermoleophilia bacterium]